MALPGNRNFSDYDNYITDTNPTTSAQAQDYFRNQAELLKAVIDCDFWQPETVYQPGDVVKSDSMPNGTEAVMVATKASVTSDVEPQWGAVGGANISDGACFWKLRWKHWSKDVASVDDMKNGVSDDKIVTPKLARLGQNATNRLPNTAYSVGNVVYVDSNLSVALKCTIAGTTSNTELDISGNNVDDTVTDGSVVWQVCNRTSDVTSVNGKTGDVVVDTLPIGTSIMYMGDTVPDGYLAENGAAISRTTYAKLFAVIGTKYGAGDGSTTFNLPNKNNGSFAEGSNTAGTVKSAGLPNINGSVLFRGADNGGLAMSEVLPNDKGAFNVSGANEIFNAAYTTIAKGSGQYLYIDASRSSSVYGNSITVQPKSVTVKFCIKY